MNNLKKIGLSALAGSLVAVSAQAAEMGVTGTWNLTYKSIDNSDIGQQYGSNTELGFSGSGDVNGMTATYFTALANGGGAVVSHLITLDMGDMGMVGFDQGVGKFGIGTIDDKTPSAYEESWDGTTNASAGLGGNGGSSGNFGYKNTMMGFALNLEYAPAVGAADLGNGGAGTATQSTGSSINWALSNSTLVDGLEVGFGMGEDDANNNTTGVTDVESITGYLTYAMGPITVGYQQAETSGGAAGAAINHVTAYGVAFNVNENLSLSLNNHENEYKKYGANANVTQESTGLAIAYTMGSASVKIQQNDQDNVSGTAGTNYSGTEVSLSLAF